MFERVLRITAPTALVLFVVVGALMSELAAATTVVAAGATCLVGVVLAARAVTGWPAVAGLALAAVGITVLCATQPANVGWFGTCVLAAWAVFTTPALAAGVFSAVLVAGFGVQWLIVDDAGWAAWIAGTLFTVVACLMAARQRLLLEQLQAAQAGLAERAAADERARIAHELHDVLGHALTVSLLHVTSARLALADDPDEAAAALAEAERLSRRSLAEVRSVVASMNEPGASTPLPGAGDLDDLVASFLEAGAAIDWRVEGDLATLTAAEALTVYRILQEALTNAVRHAPGARVSALVDAAGAQTRVVIDNDRVRVGARSAATSDGTGLTSMRARAQSLGGTCSVGPSERGWRVEAVIP